VLELNRLLETEGELKVMLGANHIRVEKEGIRLTSKLIDGRFPEYGRVIPKDPANVLTADRHLLRQALQRTAILSNEKYRGVRLELSQNSVVMHANNPEQEEAVETLEVEYSGAAMEIGFNVNYLLDALGAVESDGVEVRVTDGNSSCLIVAPGDASTKYVVMPMRL
jgi:DNA polymerase-3 subunit beta